MKAKRKQKVLKSFKICVNLDGTNLDDYIENLYRIEVAIAKNKTIVE